MKLKHKILFFIGFLTIFLIIFFFRDNILSHLESFANWAYPNEENKNGEITKLLISIIGGIVIIFGLRAALIRAKASQRSVEIQSKSIDNQTKQIELATESQTNEVFKNAIEHLGSEKESIVLGGIYELHFLAIENPIKYAEIVSNILCSKLRTESSIKKEAEKISKTISQTIIDLVLKTEIYSKIKKDISFCNLNSIKFNDIEIYNTNISFSRLPFELKNIKFIDCKISGTKTVVGRYENLTFDNCYLFGSYFRSTQFTGLTINSNEGINKLICLDCEFKNSTFNFDYTASIFMACEFKTTDFKEKDISSINFTCSSFKNIDFGVSEIGNCNFSGCGFVNTTSNSWIQNCIFKGNKNDYKYYSQFFKKQLEKSLGESNLNGFSYNNSKFLKNTIAELNEKDTDDLILEYNKNIEIDEKRKKAL